MATKSWTGGTSSTWTTAANWSGAAVPIANDDVVINDSTTNAVAGIDQHTIDLDSLSIGPDYAKAFGSAGSYVIVAADKVMISTASQSATNKDIYYDDGTSAAADQVIINSTASNQIVYLKGSTAMGFVLIVHGHVKLVSGTFTSVNVCWDGNGTRPIVEVEGCTITTLNVAKNCSVIIDDASATVTNLNVDGGMVEANDGTLTNIVQRGGTIHDNTSATTTTLYVFGGTFDASGCVRGKTYTTSRTLGADGTVILDNKLGTITTTTVEEFAAPILTG